MAIVGNNHVESAIKLCGGDLWRERALRSPGFGYVGCDESESMGEYLLDIGMTESDFVGFDVGDQ